MECPNCKTVASPKSLIRCAHCGMTWERQYLEEYEHIEFTLRWLASHRQQVGDQTDSLQEELSKRAGELERIMGLAKPEPVQKVVEPPPPPGPEPEKPPEAVPVMTPVIVVEASARAPEPVLVGAASAPIPAAPSIQPRPKVLPPSLKPERPPVDWSKVWDKAVNFVVSGALLRALLYLGAFMIVVSAAVLVISFWDIFPPILQVVFIFALPTAFYAAGWLVRSRLKLAQAGMVLTGVGEILLAVDFAALYQFSNLNINFSLYWLVASLFTTIIYSFTAFRLDGEFFDYLALVGGANILVALSSLAGMPLYWSVATVTLSGLGMVGLSTWAWEGGKAWRDTARAARYLPQVVIPISLLVILANGWDTLAAVASAFFFAALAYGLLAWKFPALYQLILALVSFALAAGFGLAALESFNWMAAAAAVISAGYILGGLFLPLDASKFVLANKYRKILRTGGYLLAAVSSLLVLWYAMAFRYDLEVAIALTLLALSFCAWNVLLRRPLFGYIGGVFLVLAAGAWFAVISLDNRFIALAYLVLISATNLPAGIVMRRIDMKLAAPFERTGWLVAAWIFGVSAMDFGGLRYNWVPSLTLTLLAAYLVFHTWHYHHQAFAWGTAIVVPVSMARWLGYLDIPLELQAYAWPGLALLYMLVERFLHRQKDTPWESIKIRRPFGTGIAILTATGFALASIAYFTVQEKQIPFTLAAQLLSLGTVILFARVYRTRWPLFFEPLMAVLLALMFFYTYSQKLLGFELTFYEYGLVLSGTAWLHLLAAAVLDPQKTRYAHGLYLGGYAFLTLAVPISILDLPLLLSTLGLFVLAMVSSAVLVQANRHHTWVDLVGLFGKPEQGFVRFVRSTFVWLAAWLFPAWCALLLVQLKVPAGFSWLGLGVPALLYLPLGTRLGKLDKQYERAFFSAGHAFNLVALYFSVGRVLRATDRVVFSLTLPQIKPIELYIAQGIVQALAVIFYSTWAWMKKRLAFSHVAAWLSILPFTSLLLVLNVPAKWIVISWSGWAALLLGAGYLLDNLYKEKPRFGQAPYLAGYLMLFLSLCIAAAEQWTRIIVLAICILCSAFSFVAGHLGRHPAFEDFVQTLWTKENLSRRAAHLMFLFFAVYALPLWAAMVEGYNLLPHAWQGVTLALFAPLYIAAGLLLRRLDPDYTWPFYSAGYALTAIGAMVAFEDQRIATYVLALDIVVYSASAVIFRQAFWLYLATILAPVDILIALDNTGRLMPQWVAWIFTGVAFLYFVAGQVLDRRNVSPTSVNEFAPPFYIPGYLLSAIALAVSAAVSPSGSDRILALWIFPVNIVLYALSAWRFRELLFLYPAAWLSAVPYYLFVTTFLNIRTEWLGATWLPLILALIGLGRLVFHRAPVLLNTPKAIFSTLANHAAMPFYTIAYVLSVTMILGSRWTPLSLTIGSALATLLYFGSSLLFRHPGWLYPALLTAHLGVLAYFTIDPSGSPARNISLPFLALTWLEAIAGFIVSRRYPVTRMTSSGKLAFKLFKRDISFGDFPSIGFLAIPSWAQPIFIFMGVDIVLWESVALSGLDTGAWVSAGFFILLALLGMAWTDQLLAHLSLGFAMTAAGFQLASLGMSTPQVFASLSGLAFLLFLLSWLVELAPVLSMWRRPLLHAATVAAGLGLLVTLPLAFQETIPTAFALGFNGAIYLTMSLRKRTYLLGYFGMGLLLAGWSLFLFVRNVDQPQFYAIPAGLYFTGMGFFEHTRRPGRFAMLIESLGLALLLVTSFVQSLDGKNGFPYFLLLFVESLLVVWWGAARRVRVPFIAGLAASVINVLAQIVVLVRVYEVNRWIIIFSAGILLVGLGLFVERRREILLSRAQEFRGMLETWE